MNQRAVVIHRLRASADFQRVLAIPARSRSAHFALHYLPAPPPAPRQWVGRSADKAGNEVGYPVLIPALITDLSTGEAAPVLLPVDDHPGSHWLGYVIPKRHAKRAVTRNLLKRQIRSLFGQHVAALAPGQWLVRLRTSFATATFVSARSDALARAARLEIEWLLTRAHVRTQAGPQAGPSNAVHGGDPPACGS